MREHSGFSIVLGGEREKGLGSISSKRTRRENTRRLSNFFFFFYLEARHDSGQVSLNTAAVTNSFIFYRRSLSKQQTPWPLPPYVLSLKKN